MGAFLALLFFAICPLAAVTFIARVVCVPFSTRISEQMRRHPLVHWAWGGLAFLGVLVFLGVVDPSVWPPASVERREQQKQVWERVEAAGGWAAVQRDCERLVEQHRAHGFWWGRGDTNALPPALAALRPWSVQLESPPALRGLEGEPVVSVVRIKIFGIHSTGGRSAPYFGLEVVSGPGADAYRPRPSQGGVSGNRYRSCRPVTDRIYEIY